MGKVGMGLTMSLDGYEHGANVSLFIIRNRPDTGPGLHRHPYEETFIVQEGGHATPSAGRR
jgi:hypothetical protein